MARRLISEAELAKHNTENDLWVAIEGKVYDLTAYKTHPGGFQVLVDVGGRDGTVEYLDANHPSYVEEDMPQYYIGDLQADEADDAKVPGGARQINGGELSLHSKAGDVWLAIHGKVYDISKFGDHPGGPDILLEHANSDATQAFEDHGHGEEARKLMKKFYIGEYVPGKLLKVEEVKAHNDTNERKLIILSNRAYSIEAFAAEQEIYRTISSLTHDQLLDPEPAIQLLLDSPDARQRLSHAYQFDVLPKKNNKSVLPVLLLGLIVLFCAYLAVTSL
jgi:cytochrome b involved in lipid metabolism